MYSSLMGMFNLPPPTARINAISSSRGPSRKEFFRTHYFSDPWTLPSSTTTLDGGLVGGIEFPMSIAELSYQSIVNSTDNHPTPFSQEELDGDVALAWTLDSTSALDCLDIVLPSEEEILEAMMGVDQPWEDLHHHSYFLPPLHEIESRLSNLSTSDVCTVSNPLALAQFSAGNMSVISRTILVNISRNPNVIENVFIGADCSPEEIQIYTDPF